MNDDPPEATPEYQLVCAGCHAPWHPTSGTLVGSPVAYRMCGRCWRESLACAKWATGRRSKKWGGADGQFYGALKASKKF